MAAHGWSAATTMGSDHKKWRLTLKGLGLCAITLSGLSAFFAARLPGFSLRSNPGLKLANPFGVFRSSKRTSLQLLEFALRLDQDRDLLVGILPDRKEILIRLTRLQRVALHCRGARERQMRKRP
jgi:hypothetical protein